MPTCSNENCCKFIIGGFRSDGLRFCNQVCYLEGYNVILASEIPLEIIDSQAQKIFNEICPKCNNRKPIDVHTSYRIISLIILSRKTINNVSCRLCGIKSQIRNFFISLFFGWWSHGGIVYTPAYLMSNIVEVFRSKSPNEVSPKLKKYVKRQISIEKYNEMFNIKDLSKILKSSRNSPIKNFLIKMFIPVKESDSGSRVASLILLCLLLGFMIFDVLTDNAPVSLTTDEIYTISKENLPKYIKIKDKISPVDSYIEYRDKQGKGNLKYIIYSVSNSKENTFLLVKDSQVQEDDLQKKDYFSLNTSNIVGKIGSLEDDTKRALEKEGYKVVDKALIIEKDELPISISSALMVILPLIFLSLFILLSLMSDDVIIKVFSFI